MPSGTTTSAPRPAASATRTAAATHRGQRGPSGPAPGIAFHTARGARPSASAARKNRPAGYAAHSRAARSSTAPSGPGAAFRPEAASAGSASTRACRGGMASRSTSESVPAYRSATARARRAISGVSTGSGETTRSR